MAFSLFKVAQPSPQSILEHFITLRRNPIPFSGHPLFVRLQYQRPPAMKETQGRPLGWKDPLEKETATYSSILAWDRGAWRATVHGVTRVRHDLVTKSPAPFSLPPASGPR